MAKEVIVLSIDAKANLGSFTFSYLLWLKTPTPVPAPQFVSRYPGIVAAEVTALQSGATIEESYVQMFPNTMTKAQIQAFLQAHFQSRQAAFAVVTQPGTYFGVFFDSVTGWSA